jgi:hypothetical protein
VLSLPVYSAPLAVRCILKLLTFRGLKKNPSYRAFKPRFSPLGELLSFACSKVSNQRKKHPATTAFGFPVLLDNLGGCGTRPSKLYKTQLAAELKQSSPKTPSLSALLGVIERENKTSAVPIIMFFYMYSAALYRNQILA